MAACVMTFEARDSAAKVTPARPTALPRPAQRRCPPCAPTRFDQLGVYRLPHVLPLPHELPLLPPHRHHHRPTHVADRFKSSLYNLVASGIFIRFNFAVLTLAFYKRSVLRTTTLTIYIIPSS